MHIDLFLDELKNKFNYDEKVITALYKIIPNLIKYFGIEYSDLIKSALLDCEIINCSSRETINMIKKDKTSFKIIEDNSLIKEEDNTGVYYSLPIIKYDTNIDTYVISMVKRYIIISHTYNLDSARGIAILTHNICHLIKSFYGEYKINDNILIRRSGLRYDKYMVDVLDGEIVLTLLSDINVGLEEGINSLDEESILKLILDDSYETFDYQNTKYIGLCLKNKLNLKKVIEDSQLLGDISIFIDSYGLKEYESLSYLADQSCELEDKRNNYDITREELININKEISYIIPNIVDNMTIYLSNNH